MKTKSNNNPSKLQSEAVKQIDDLNWDTDKGVMTKAKVIKQSTGETVGQITMPVTKEMIKTFVADQIQKAYSKGREEIEPFKTFLLNEGYSEEAIDLIGYKPKL